MKFIVATLILIGLLIAVLFSVKYVFANNGTKTQMYDAFISANTPESSPASIVEKQPEQKVQLATTELDAIFKKYADEYPGIELSIEVVDIDTNKKYQFNADRVSIGASVTKMFTASTFLSELEKGTYTFETKLGSYASSFQLQQLVRQSNNISWELFYDLLGRKKIESYTHSIGAKQFDISKNSLTALDMSVYLQKLSKNELHSQENTKLLMSYMQNTYDDTFVPETVLDYELYHKNGQIDATINEAIIAKNDIKTVVLSIFTDGKDKWEYAERRQLLKGLVTDILTALK